LPGLSSRHDAVTEEQAAPRRGTSTVAPLGFALPSIGAKLDAARFV